MTHDPEKQAPVQKRNSSTAVTPHGSSPSSISRAPSPKGTLLQAPSSRNATMKLLTESLTKKNSSPKGILFQVHHCETSGHHMSSKGSDGVRACLRHSTTASSSLESPTLVSVR
eukprot:scaffold20753_cov21-Tisochrysis_lutea.AAC.1